MAVTVDGHPRTYEEAMEDFKAWSTDFQTVADPLRRAARIMAALAHVMAEVIETQTKSVTRISDRMAVVNDVLKLVNAGITRSKDNGSETAEIPWMQGSEQELAVAVSVFRAAGIQSKSESSAEGMYQVGPSLTFLGQSAIYISPRNLTYVQSALQIDLQKLGSTQQNDQMRVQTAVGRYNATFELISSLIKKSETQGDAVGNGIKT
jgi:hypothetical protein